MTAQTKMAALRLPQVVRYSVTRFERSWPERHREKPSDRSAYRVVFRKEGEYWTVGYGGKAFHLKDITFEIAKEG
jgi:hypothetical protein